MMTAQDVGSLVIDAVLSVRHLAPEGPTKAHL
jgi:hypothetical protein